ncbi:MAG: hypothetical protein JXR25_03235 [Pontiellaceae bacterium]|nr:hypothetical protein [Pontiellaceae bacterium]MBN2783817.1 hypothetical protein [Pontiellaceae bacterium]
MKHKTTILGIIWYIGLQLSILFIASFFEIASIPYLSRAQLYLLCILSLCCISVSLRTADQVSLKGLSIATGLLSTVIALILLTGLDCYEWSLYMILAIFFAVLWLIAASGIVLAGIITNKWNSERSRKRCFRLPLITILCAVLLQIPINMAMTAYALHVSEKLTAPLLTCRASELQSSCVVPTLQETITSGTNLIWCAPFQLAWNEMTDLLGENIRFAENEPDCVAALNHRSVTGEFLDEETYLAFGGPYTESFADTINRSVTQKFGIGAFPPVAPPIDHTQQLAAFSYLSVNLPFQYAFERSNYPMIFNGTPVQSFTIPFSNGANIRAERAKRQVAIMYPPDEENSFIVELISRKTDHHLLLAKIAPAETLEKTVKKTCVYVDTLERRALDTNQGLEVPLFNFDITRDYSELTGSPLKLTRPDYADWQIGTAQQNIRFQLDERGAVLKSNAFLVCFSCMATPDCIFDEPFLLMLRYKDNPMPYFAMWIDNAEILVEPEL